MEFLNKAAKQLMKYRYVALVLMVGLLLMVIPFNTKQKSETQSTIAAVREADITEELTAILSKIHGAGKVMLTIETGKNTVYQYDTDVSGGEDGSLRQDTVIVTDENRVQSGLIQHITAPEYRGAIIVCEGADKPEVRLHIIEAVASVTGLGTDKITVLKMK